MLMTPDQVKTLEKLFDQRVGENLHAAVIGTLRQYERVLENLTACVKRHGLGLSGERIDQIVIDALDRAMEKKA